MIIKKIDHYTDSPLTVERAKMDLDIEKVTVAHYKNQYNDQSVVHSHPYHEIIVPISGSTVHYSASGRLIELRNKELIFFPAGNYHSGKYNIDKESSERLVIQIAAEIWDKAVKLSGIQSLTWDQDITILSTAHVSEWDMIGLFERMAQTKYLNDDSLQNKIYYSQTMELIIFMNHCIASSPVQNRGVSNPLIAKAVYYIQEHYCEQDLTVNKIASECYISREHLSRVFKEYTMESVQAYLTHIRMEHCRRMISSGKSILDSSMESGFSNYSSFVKIFRKLYGITPAEYKATILGKSD